MIRRITVAALQLGALAFSLAAFLFADGLLEASSGIVGSTIRDLNAVFRDSATQWMVLVCLLFYLIAFSILEIRSSPAAKRSRAGIAIFFQFAFVALVILPCVFGYSKTPGSTVTLIVLGAIVLGKMVFAWANSNRCDFEHSRTWLTCLLICILAGSVFWQKETTNTLQYNGESRWSGVWNNPNLFGLLMGTCLVLSLGLGIQARRAALRQIWRSLGTLCCALAVLIVGVGLFKSYSRGAWVSTLAGVAYLVWNKVKIRRSVSGSLFWNGRNGIRVVVILFALAALVFWQFRFIEWRPARRVFSATNINDFSWRNRVAAWNGAVRMMEEQPFVGYGWGAAEAVYGKKYRPPQLENGAAIQMNDYFMLGISAGVPALLCFLVYVWLSLKSPSPVVHRPIGAETATALDFELWTLDWTQTVCRAGAIVLLVGFFFDGGLFKLATGSVFWILLELGRVDPDRARHSVRAAVEKQKDPAQEAVALYRRTRWETWLRRSAWILGIAAVSESAILLTTPFFGVSNTTLAVSRHYLVPASAVADLNLLATNVDWNSRKLRPLLQHASLANYNRQLINWKLDDQIYRDYVLNPLIGPRRDGQLAWRRSLWEYFYPPIRKENYAESAAQIVLKFLHQRISTVENGPITIQEMWQQKNADAKGLESLKVAAFRSVGIPARLNIDQLAEIFADGKWQIPSPEH
jgi:O-antigen ligase